MNITIFRQEEGDRFLLTLTRDDSKKVHSFAFDLDVEELKKNDRIVFIGHGTELGLLDIYGNRYTITSEDLQLFRDKPVICYWCNANIFAEKYDLNAFATGMFVSELKEAKWYNLPLDQNLIDNSNELFCRILSRCVFDDPKTIRSVIKRGYVGDNPIIKFNRQCMGFE